MCAMSKVIYIYVYISTVGKEVLAISDNEYLGLISTMQTPHHVTHHSFHHLRSCSKSRIAPEPGESCLFYGCLIFLSVEGDEEQSLLMATSLLENMLDALKSRRNRPCSGASTKGVPRRYWETEGASSPCT